MNAPCRSSRRTRWQHQHRCSACRTQRQLDGTRSGFWGGRPVKALDDVSFDIFPGETLGLVGESGSGKTTTGRAILRRVGVTAGPIIFKGEDITEVRGEELRQLRRHMQLVFQDPYASLNPRMKVLDIIAEPLIVHGLIRKADEARDEIAELLRIVGLPRDAQRPLPARLLRRPAPADRHRPRAGAQARLHRRRRAGLGPRRLDPGAGGEPARRTSSASSA